MQNVFPKMSKTQGEVRWVGPQVVGEHNESVYSSLLGLNADDLTVSAIIEEGPALRRFRPCARGSAHPFRKRQCHIRITLTDSV